MARPERSRCTSQGAGHEEAPLIGHGRAFCHSKGAVHLSPAEACHPCMSHSLLHMHTSIDISMYCWDLALSDTWDLPTRQQHGALRIESTGSTAESYAMHNPVSNRLSGWHSVVH